MKRKATFSPILSEARLTPVSQTQPELSVIFSVCFYVLGDFPCCCDNFLFEENGREEKREGREKRKETEGRKNEIARTKSKKQGGKTDKKEKKEKEASNAERGERRQAKRARRADKQKGRQDRRETEKSVGGSMMSKHMNSTSGSVGPGEGITAKVCDFGLASSSYRTTASHHFGQLW